MWEQQCSDTLGAHGWAGHSACALTVHTGIGPSPPKAELCWGSQACEVAVANLWCQLTQSKFYCSHCHQNNPYKKRQQQRSPRRVQFLLAASLEAPGRKLHQADCLPPAAAPHQRVQWWRVFLPHLHGSTESRNELQLRSQSPCCVRVCYYTQSYNKQCFLSFLVNLGSLSQSSPVLGWLSPNVHAFKMLTVWNRS